MTIDRGDFPETRQILDREDAPRSVATVDREDSPASEPSPVRDRSPQPERNNLLFEEGMRYRDVLHEYGVLALKPSLSDAEADRLAEILESAQLDPCLGFLLEEIDHAVGHLLGLIDTEAIADCQTRAWDTLAPHIPCAREFEDLIARAESSSPKLLARREIDKYPYSATRCNVYPAEPDRQLA